MKQTIAHVALIVHDYDEAIQFYTTKLNFILVEDTKLSDTKRWVLIAPTGNTGTQILLARADQEEQKKAVGNQSGGRVFLFLHTDDFYRDYHDLKEKGVEFVREPVHEAYGIVAVFKDLYGNLWDLIDPHESADSFQVSH
ncbi:MAG: VOC family protein [Bacteroidota bacterium]